jgi:hypothetical protein
MFRRVITAILVGVGSVGAIRAADDLAEQFVSPPPAARCWTYWYWHAKASKEGVTRDLEAMRRQGIEGVLVFPFGEYMKPRWLPMFRHVLDEAERLKLEIVLNNDSFWSCQAPWITPEHAEKRLVCSESAFDGGRRIAATLPAPPIEGKFYRDVVVLACPVSGKRAAGTDESGDSQTERDLKCARTMYPSYPAGGLDVFYRRSAETPGEEAIAAGSAVDISGKMQPDGRLDWEAPAGRWIVLRFGYAILRKECPDFFSRTALDHHLRQSVEKLLPIAGRHVGKTWTHVHEDSYENGAQTWTPAFREEFRRRRGYDMTPWMPVLAGRVVGSRALSNRFLHDYRRTISDLYVENHFQHFSDRLRAMGLKFSTEGGYGWASAVADGLRIEAVAEIPMGEFWHAQRHPISGQRLEKQFAVHGLDLKDAAAHRAIPYGFGLNSIRLAASAAHVYGRPYCQAESFTSYTEGGYDLCNSPFSLKATGDRAFCDGLGRVAFHVYSLQTDTTDMPDQVWLGVGIHFNRNVTWWSRGRAFTDYLSRCQLLLRQGKFVADFAYWSGDTMPYECPDRVAMRPSLPHGCNADVINTDVLLNRMTVKDGRLVLPDGVAYRYLVLPPTRDTADPKSLGKIKELIEAGATVVLGPRPVSAAGLERYPKCDEDVRGLADAIWGRGESAKTGERTIGRGRAVWGRELADLLKADGIPQDIEVGGAGAASDFEWIHHRDNDADVYFVSNQADGQRDVELRFRATGRQVVLWDPVWGTRRALHECREERGVTVVPARFAARQSWFFVFTRSTTNVAKSPTARNFPASKRVLELGGGWRVSFDPKWGGPANVVFDKLDDWTKRPEEAIKFYSGTATYRKAFDLPASLAGGQLASPLYLDLGEVKDLAEVRLNGRPLGVIWTAPWRVDVSGAVRQRGNELEIDVVNQWPNRLIGDSRLPPDKQLTRSNYRLKPDDPLVPSGLIGPVTLQIEE